MRQYTITITLVLMGVTLVLLTSLYSTDIATQSNSGKLFIVPLLLANLLAITIIWAWFRHDKNKDVQALTASHKQLFTIEQRHKALMDSIPDLAWVKDTESRFIAVNKQFGVVFGIEPDELVGKTDFDLSPSEDAQHYQQDDMEVMQSGQPKRVEERITGAGGQPAWAETIKVPVFDEAGNVVGTAGVARDITERKAAEAHIEFLANHDALTMLPNRRLLEDRLQQYIAHAQRQDEKLAVLFLDLDYFKSINDSVGHNAGDQLLQQIASRLKSCLRDEDTIARIGGDEFVIILPGIHSKENISGVAQKILSAVNQPYYIDKEEYNICTSIGISLFPDHGDNISALLRNADIAMYHAKELGRDRFHFFMPNHYGEALERYSLEHQIREAHKAGEFTVYYQPIINIKTRKIHSIEALLRWNKAGQSIICSNEFIAAAEASGLIITLGNWVLRQAIAQNKAWQTAGLPAVPVTVNIANIQFRRQQLYKIIQSALQEHDLQAQYLNIEMTENVIMQDPNATKAHLQLIQALGVSIIIDDFGTGFSNMNMLLSMAIDKIKIDHSLIHNLGKSQNAHIVASSIIQMAKNLQLEIIAEGVETAEEVAFIKQYDCHAAQGFFYCKPVPADTVKTMLLTGSIVEPELSNQE